MKKQQETPKQNNVLAAARKRIIIQTVIAVQTLVITVLLVFGLSAAWYTNVVQTSGLQFEAEAWGFDGEVFVSEDPIQAAPGQSDIIGLSVSNSGGEIVDVAVSVSKEQMATPMQQRLYFYVDTVSTRNGEIMDRVYINTKDSYTYALLGGNELVLTKERANDALVKWQWVYDMQGYYFLGTVQTVTAEDGTVSCLPAAEDYLRPVEYALDGATFDDEGFLATVGGQTAEEFLQALAAKDGYTGAEVTATEMPGYYKLNVDDEGYGIWVYLCTWDEIQQATEYDSRLGSAAAQALAEQEALALEEGQTAEDTAENTTGETQTPATEAQTRETEGETQDTGDEAQNTEGEASGGDGTQAQTQEQTGEAAQEDVLPDKFVARLIITGQSSQREYVEVSTAEQLREQLNGGGMVKLGSSLTVDSPIVVVNTEKAVLDLNGNKITGPVGDNTIQLNPASELTILNGTIEAREATKDVVSVTGGMLTLSKVNITGEGDDAIDIADQNSDEDSVVRLVDSTIDVAGCAVFMRGNGDRSADSTRIIIENCSLNSGYVTLMGNGSNTFRGTDVQIYNSTLTGLYAAVYQPQSDSITKAMNSTLTGGTGVVIKGGDLELVNSKVYGTDAAAAPAYEGSGFTQTGDAVLVDCSYGVGISVRVTEDEALAEGDEEMTTLLSSANNMALRVFVPENMANTAVVTITGGSFVSGAQPLAVPEGFTLGQYVPAGYVYTPSETMGSVSGTVAAGPDEEDGAANG